MTKLNQKGITIIEVFVALFIISFVMIGLYTLFNFGVRVLGDNRARVDASALANQRMEMIRNLTYDDVGTEGGIPAGTIPQSEVITMNRIVYTITTAVLYVDDPFDGLAGGIPDDLFNADYKRVRIQVSWPTMLNDNPVILITDVAPKGIETDVNGGTLSITVFDAAGDPVPMANVHIENTDIVPNINIDTQTTAGGRLTIPGMPPAIETYDAVITKAGYSTDRTYEVDLVNNPNPSPPPLTIFEGVVTEVSFSIDRLSTLTMNTKNLDESALGGIDFTLRGSKTIGTDGDGDPIYKYEVNHSTDANGTTNIPDMEWDSYEFIIDNVAIGYDIAGNNPPLPVSLLPDASHSVDVYFATQTDNSLLITVRGQTGNLIENAEVHLSSVIPPYDATQNTTSYGQTFFSGLENINYDIEVTAAGYQETDMEMMVDGPTAIDVFLTEL